MQVNEGPQYISFGDYLRVVRERRVLVVLITVLFAGAALSYALQRPPTYSAETALNFQNLNDQGALFGLTQNPNGGTPDERAAASARTVVTTDVLDRAAKHLNRKLRAAALFGKVSARPMERAESGRGPPS